MRILYTITSSIIGGAQTNVLQLVEYFEKRGDEVRVMSFPGDNLEKELLKMGIKFYPNPFFCGYFDPIRNFKTAVLIRKAIEDFKPDIVHCHSTQAGFLTRLAAGNKVDVVFTAHGWAFAEGTPFFRKWPVMAAEKLAALFCKKIICVSEQDRLLALKWRIAPAEKLATVYNGTDIPEELPEKKYSYPLKVVFAARMAKQKDPFSFAKAVKLLDPDLKKKISVLMIGEGPESTKFKKFVSDIGLEEEIKIENSFSNKDLMDIFKESHIFVLTSHWEGLPIVILEAMAHGMAIVASDVGGVAETFGEDCGFLVKRKNVREIKDSLEKLIQNKEMAERMGAAGFRRAKKDFSVQRMLAETEKIYSNLKCSKE